MFERKYFLSFVATALPKTFVRNQFGGFPVWLFWDCQSHGKGGVDDEWGKRSEAGFDKGCNRWGPADRWMTFIEASFGFRTWSSMGGECSSLGQGLWQKRYWQFLNGKSYCHHISGLNEGDLEFHLHYFIHSGKQIVRIGGSRVHYAGVEFK